MAASTLSMDVKIVMRERVFAWMSSDRGLVANLIPPSPGLNWSDEQQRGWVQELVSAALEGNEAAKNRVLIREAAAALRRAADECAARANCVERAGDDIDLLAAMIVQLDVVWDLLRPDYVRKRSVSEVEDAYLAAQLELRTVHVLRAVSEAFVLASDPQPDGRAMHGVLEASVVDRLVANAPRNPDSSEEWVGTDAFKRRATEILEGCNSGDSDLLFLKWFEDKCALYPISAVSGTLQTFLRKLDLDDCWIVHMHNLEKDIEDGLWIRSDPEKLPTPGQEPSGDEEPSLDRDRLSFDSNEVREGRPRDYGGLSQRERDKRAARALAMNTLKQSSGVAASPSNSTEPKIRRRRSRLVDDRGEFRNEPEFDRSRSNRVAAEIGEPTSEAAANSADESPATGRESRMKEDGKAGHVLESEGAMHERLRGLPGAKLRDHVRASEREPSRTGSGEVRETRRRDVHLKQQFAGERRTIDNCGPFDLLPGSGKTKANGKSKFAPDSDLDNANGDLHLPDDLGAAHNRSGTGKTEEHRKHRRNGGVRALDRETFSRYLRRSSRASYLRKNSRQRGHGLGRVDHMGAGLEHEKRGNSADGFSGLELHASKSPRDRTGVKKTFDNDESATTNEDLEDSQDHCYTAIGGSRRTEQEDMNNHPAFTQMFSDMYDDDLEPEVGGRNDSPIKSPFELPVRLTNRDHFRAKVSRSNQRKVPSERHLNRTSRKRMRDDDSVDDEELLADDMENEIADILRCSLKPDTARTSKTRLDQMYRASRGKRGRFRNDRTDNENNAEVELSDRSIAQGLPASDQVEKRKRGPRTSPGTRVNRAASTDLGRRVGNSESRQLGNPSHSPLRGTKGNVSEILRRTRTGTRNLYGFKAHEDRTLLRLIRDYGYGEWEKIAVAGKARHYIRANRTPAHLQHRAQELARVS